MRRPALGALTIQTALLLGFGLMLGLWVWSAYDFTRRMGDAERDASGINVRFMHAQELLANVRPQVLVVSVNVRNILIDPDRANHAEYRERIDRTLREVDAALEEYVPVVNSDAERQRVERLRLEIEAYATAIGPVIAGGRARTADDARMLLGRIAPRRELIIGVTDEVQALNRAAFVQQQRAIADMYRSSQRAIWIRLGLSVAGGFVIALLAAGYAGRLEDRLRRQREIQERDARDLHRLSARLVTAQEEERRTIARELHDEVGQVLTAIRVELSIAQKKLAGGPAAALLDDAQAITETALHTVRDLSHLLHPALLDDLGLVAAIDWYLQAYGKRHGIRVELRQDNMAERLGSDVEVTIYRVIQEALTNVVKHARATSCRVSLRRFPQGLQVTVEDDGRGFDPSGLEAGGIRSGLGLLGIRERVSPMRGDVRIDSAPGRGTRLIIDLPLAERPSTPVKDAIDEVVPAPAGEVVGG